MPEPKIHTRKEFLVNGIFVEKLLEKFGNGMSRIPYGYRIYPDMTGSNEICLIKHDPIPELGNDYVWLVIMQPDREEIFRNISEEILKGKKKMARQRLVSEADLSEWTLTKEASLEKEAGQPQGLYGYTRKIQAMCESADRRLQRKASSLIRKAHKRDERVLEFLGTHSKRAKSVTARILLSSFKEGLPKLASEEDEIDAGECTCGGDCLACQTVSQLRMAADSIEKSRRDILNAFKKHSWEMQISTWDKKEFPLLGGKTGTPGSRQMQSIFQQMLRDGTIIKQGTKYVVHRNKRMASSKLYSMYGYPLRTAEVSLKACNDLRIEAGHIAADLHQRQAAMYDKITGFFNDHVKTAKSLSSKLLLSVYPEQMMFKTASSELNVDEWLSLDPEF